MCFAWCYVVLMLSHFAVLDFSVVQSLNEKRFEFMFNITWFITLQIREFFIQEPAGV